MLLQQKKIKTKDPFGPTNKPLYYYDGEAISF